MGPINDWGETGEREATWNWREITNKGLASLKFGEDSDNRGLQVKTEMAELAIGKLISSSNDIGKVY